MLAQTVDRLNRAWSPGALSDHITDAVEVRCVAFNSPVGFAPAHGCETS